MFALLLAASLLTASPAADVAVDLDARHAPVLLPGARYYVTVTNNGPDPLTSATVTVQLEHPVIGTPSGQCPYDSATGTLTCTFGPLPVGGTATMDHFVYYNISGPARDINATATRTASTPPDPNPANDTDAKSCWYRGPTGMPPTLWPPPMTC